MSSRVESGIEIRTFNVDIPEDELADLRRRIAATRWPDGEPDASQGVQLETIQALAASADGRAYVEKFLGAYSHRFIAGIGHNVPQAAPGVVTDAILEVGGGLP